MVSVAAPILAVAAASGSGKTTLLTRLLPELRAQGVRCAVIKHSHHDVEFDVPGKDTHRLREAGAAQVLLASPYRCFWVEEGDGVTEPPLQDMLCRLDLARINLVLVEGYRHERLPKIEIHRTRLGKPLLCTHDPDVIAVATDAPAGLGLDLPCLPLNDARAVAAFVIHWMRGKLPD
ncbi:MAG: molybdopterin-guanine dinucleotide biosynthesis protein B [Gammaproteobacteria bacterium]|nr:molybdopterin-guanine dinucleotide biosynthesis protein B [Gammaproteobacteria bacterium]